MPVEIGVGVGISFPPPRSFKPSDIFGLGLWVDAFDLNTFSFSTGVVVDGWRDKVSNISLTQATAAKRPDRQVTLGKIGVDFDSATDDFLSTSAPAIPQDMFDGGGYYVFVFSIGANTDAAGRLFQAGNNVNVISFQQIADGARFDFQMKFSTTNIVEVSGSDDVSLDTIHIVEIEYNSDDVSNRTTVRLDGAVLSMTQTSTPIGTRLVEGASKAFGGNGTIGIDGAIYEANLFQSIPSAIDKDKIMTRLANRWGVTLA